ncbi:YDG domain-containing protein, partial [Roseateles toxinivorans]
DGGDGGKGGQIQLLGRQVGLTDRAAVSASGAAGGGQVLVGGGQEGKDASVPNSEAVFFGKDAGIKADATARGDGGRIILWSDKATRAYGSLSARGGALGGDGGFIETSGGWLDARPARVATFAPKGSSGTWLLDPYDLIISNSGGESNFDSSIGTETSFFATASPSRILSSTINAALGGGYDGAGHVRITTGGAGAEAGNITFDTATLNGAYSGGSSLLVQAAGSITVNNSSFTNSSSEPSDTIKLTFNAAGNVSFANVSMPKAAGLRITGADITLLNTFVDSQFIAIDIAASGRLTLGTSTVLRSTMSGDAIILHTARFQNGNSGTQALQTPTPGSRWLVHGLDAANGSDFAPGNLAYAFKQYGGGSILGSGNGFIFSKAESAQLTSDTIQKVYDAGTSVPAISNLQVTPSVPGDKVIGTPSTAGAAYSDKNVGFEKLVTLPALGLSFTDANDKPVYGYTASALTGAITPATLIVSGIKADNKVYDGNANATFSGTPSYSVLGNDDVQITGLGSGTFFTKHVGIARSVQFFGFSGSGADASNYNIVPANSFSADITPLPLAVSGLSAIGKVYDGTATASLSGTPVIAPLGGDSVELQGTAQGLFADKDVGLGKAIGAVTGLELTGPDSFNYTLVAPEGLKADISPKTLQLALTVDNKAYDAGTAARVSLLEPPTGLIGSETVNVVVSGSFQSKHVGLNKPVLIDQIQLQDGSNGGKAGNYSFITPEASYTASITPAALVIAGLSAGSKVYDGTTAATVSGGAPTGLLQGDQVSVSFGSGSFLDKNVGSGKTVVLSGFGLSGADAGNYTLSAPASLSADITPARISVSGLTVNNKVYDATTVATLAGSGQLNALGGDAVSLGAGSANFIDKNVGTAKTVVLSGFGLSGADAGNYLLEPVANLSASISPAALAITGVSASSKVYDAGTDATLTGTAAVKALGSDSLSLGGSAVARFSDKQVGAAKGVTVTGYTLSGADAANYTVTQPTGLTASITPAPLVLGGLGVADKVYDRGTGAELVGAAGVAALGADSVAVEVGSARFSSKDVGSNKNVTLSGFGLSGADAGNYTLQLPGNLSASISPAALSVSGISANNKVYDAGTSATLSGSATVQALGNDSVSVAGTAVARFADKNVGTAKAVSVSGYTLNGADAGNYSLDLPSLSANISPAPLNIGGLTANNKVYDTTQVASLTGTAIVQPLANDVVSLAGTAVASFADKNVGVAKPVTVSGYTLDGADAGNYRAVLPALSASITPASLLYVAAPVGKAIGDAVPALSGSVTGFVGGETQQTATSGTLSFGSEVQVQTAAGSYAILGAGLSAQNYSFAQAPGNATAFTVTGLSPAATLNQGTAVAAQAVLVAPAIASSSAAGGLLDLLQAPAAGAPVAAAAALGSAAAAPSFSGIRLGDMSPDALAHMLASRDRFKKNLFADATARLEQNAALADLRLCQSAKDVEAGDCLLTEELKRRIQATVAQSVAAVAPAADTSTAAPEARSPTVNLSHKRKVKAAALPQIERKVAVVIGIDNYQDKSIPQLGNAVKDAQTVGSLFDGALGYETVVIPNASKQAVVSALNKLALELGPKDSVVIYYAGHGELVESTGLGYWQLADADAKKPETWLSNADIGRMIAQIGASQVALISDSCYSGSLVSDERIRATPGGADPQAMLARKSVVVMSSGGNEPVFDEGKNGHSPFAWNLMNQLKQVNSWQAGGNVFERVRFAVAKELPQRPKYGSSSAAGHQAGGDYLFEQRQLEAGTQ